MATLGRDHEETDSKLVPVTIIEQVVGGKLWDGKKYWFLTIAGPPAGVQWPGQSEPRHGGEAAAGVAGEPRDA